MARRFISVGVSARKRRGRIAIMCGLAVSTVLFLPITANAQVTFAILKTLTGDEGVSLNSPVVQASDGWIYGLNDACAIFKIDPSASNPASSFQIVTSVPSQNCYLGRNGLSPAPDGSFYIVSTHGGRCSQGAIYRFSLPNTLTTIIDNFQKAT